MLKKRIITIVLAVFFLANVFFVPKAQAVLGVADISVVTTAADIPRVIFQIGAKIAGVFFQQLKRRFITMLQNDLVNWVQGGGRPRFITNPKKFVQQAADQALVSSLDQFFTQHGKDICSSFRPQLQLLVQQASFVPEFGAKCTLKDINNNLQRFSQNFNDGGWETWISLHQTQNTLPGTYLAGVQTIRAKTTTAGNAVNTQVLAGKGFLDQKLCVKSSIITPAGASKIDEKEVKRLVEEDGYDEATARALAVVGNETAYKSEYKDYSDKPGGGIPKSQLGKNETCTEEITSTPGSVIGEQISGSLKSTGIDKLINAKEIAEIIDAVIDAGVNRVAREGLSLVKSGRGSYTKPARAITRLAKPAALDANRGSEGAVGIELLNKVIAYKTKTEKLINTMATLVVDRTVSSNTKVLAEGNKGGGLLKKIGFGYLGGLALSIAGGPAVIGVAGGLFLAKDRIKAEYIFGPEAKEPLSQVDVLEGRLNYIFERVDSIKCSEKEKTAGKIERCFFYGNAINFNQENNNPGPLAANKLLHKKMAEKWDELAKTLKTLGSSLATSCKIPDIRYNLNPNDPDLPFTTNDGTVFEWTKDAYQNAIDTTKVVKTDALDWKATYLELDAIPNANIQQEQNLAAVDTYKQLLTNANSTVESLRQDVDFAIITSQNIILYSGILIDYDKAGRTVKLADSYKKYTDALNKGDLETALTIRNGELFFKFADTTGEWVKIQNDIINSADPNTSPEEKDKASTKLKIINEALSIITKSFQAPEGTAEEVAETKSIIGDDPNQIWTSPAEAVSQAMINLKMTNQSMDQISDELDSRDARITRLSSDINNQIGKFPVDKEERVQLGLDGGDSEWEKYFKNRQQFVYLSMINDFYKKYISCQK